MAKRGIERAEPVPRPSDPHPSEQAESGGETRQRDLDLVAQELEDDRADIGINRQPTVDLERGRRRRQSRS